MTREPAEGTDAAGVEPESGFNTRKGMANASWLLAGNRLSYALSAITVVVVARPLGPAGYGVVSSALAFVGVFGWMALSGFDRVIVRESVREGESLEGLINATAGLKLTLGAVALVACWIGAWAFPGLTMPERVGITIASAIVLITPMNGTLSTACQVHEEMRWMAQIGIVRQALYIALAGALMLIVGTDPVVVIIAFVSAYAVALALMARVAMKWIRLRPTFRFASIDRVFFKAGVIFTLIGFFSYLYTKIDVLMIRAWGDTAQVGLYAAALTLYMRLMSTTEAFSVAFFPQIVRQAKQGTLVLMDMRKGVVALLGVGVAVTVAGWIAAPFLIPLVLGKDFVGTVLPFRILLVALAVGVPCYPLQLLFQARGMELTLVKLIPLRAALNIVLNVVALAAGLGIAGIALSTLVTAVIYYTALAIVGDRMGLIRRTVGEG
ncbi:MAG: flippase [Coriobacteriia bacterium]|nr:flippase [Coriobacteriia bacterium]